MAEPAFEPPFYVVHRLPLAVAPTATESLVQAARWWRTASTGVCCLAGIGGCGKTSTADELLRRLGVLAQRPDTGHTPLLPAPGAVFVFSLAEDSVEKLFYELRQWVPRRAGTGDDEAAYEGLIRDLGQAGRASTASGPVLLVIDALEAMQSTSGQDGVGRITDQRLRDLLTRCAYGALPGVALLITTRLAPTDIEIQRLPFYARIDMDAMDPVAAVNLLRSRGVPGTDRELRRIGTSYGYHALTLDMAARYAERSGRLPDRASDGTETGDVIAAYIAMARSGAGSPAAADLVDLLSLFRRGATLMLLTSVASRLEVATPDQVEPALRWLTELRVVTRSPRRGREDAFLMHDVVRAYVYDSLSDERRRVWHTQIAQVLEENVERSWASLDETSRFDVLEAWLSHLVQGEDPMAAFLLYWRQIGNFAAIGHQASRFAWGESVCRMLNQDLPQDQMAPYLLTDERGSGPALFGDWALYLLFLGETAAALKAQLASYQAAAADQITVQLAVAAGNVADIHIQRGELKAAEEWASEALGHANDLALQLEGMPTAEVMRGFDESTELLALTQLYMSGTNAASGVLDFLASVHAQAKGAIEDFNRYSLVPISEAPIFDIERFMWGRPLAQILLRSGKNADAERVVNLNLEKWFTTGHAEELTSVRLRALIVRSLVDRGEAGQALVHLQAVEAWAQPSETTAVLCETYLLRAKVAAVQEDFAAIIELTENGLRLAREAGLGLLHIELLVEFALASLQLGQADDASYAAATALFGQEPLTEGVALYSAPARDERLALDGAEDGGWYESSGIFPPPESGRSSLLAATHPLMTYRWGEAHARAALAEAMLAALARYSGRARGGEGQITPEADAVISYATRLLGRGADLLDELTGSPVSGRKLRDRINELREGLLTHYPIQNDSLSDTADAPARHVPRRVLISYSHSDRDFVDRLAEELRPAVDDVWVDQREINIGESFVAAINRALMGVTDFVVVLTPTATRSLWVQNELDSAIALRNAGRPLTIYPVLLDGVSAPPLIADLNAIHAEQQDAATVAAAIARAVNKGD